MRAIAAAVSLALLVGSCTADIASAPSATPTPSSSAPAPAPTSKEPAPAPPSRAPTVRPTFEEHDLPAGTRPHDVAPDARGRVWYTGQGSEEIGRLNPRTGNIRRIPLGSGSRPHGVIVGPDGDAWITEGGLNEIIRIDADTLELTRYDVPGPNANLNTAAFDANGWVWFTGQNGIYGRVNPRSGRVRVFDSPRGTGPYGITATPDGTVWFSSLAGSYIARIRDRDGRLDVVDTPTTGGGARRIWSDSKGRLYVTEWFAGKLARYNPATERWREWDLPGPSQPYAVYVDRHDLVWVTDFGTNSLVRYDPTRDRIRSYRWPSPGAAVRQLLGEPRAVWGAESATDKLVVARTR